MAAVDWFATDVARPPAAGHVVRASGPRVPRPRRRPQGRRLTGGIVWISVFAVLLTGVVALNVAVLRLNMNVSGSTSRSSQLRAENQALASQLSRAVSARRIESTAQKLGLVPAPGDRHELPRLGRK